MENRKAITYQEYHPEYPFKKADDLGYVQCSTEEEAERVKAHRIEFVRIRKMRKLKESGIESS